MFLFFVFVFFVITRTTCRKTCVSVNSHMMLGHGNNRLWKSCIIHSLVYCITNETQQQVWQTLEMYAVPHYWLVFFTIPHIYTSYTVPLYMYLQWCTGWCTQRPNLHPPYPHPDQRANEGTILWTLWRDWPTTTCPVSDVSSAFCVGNCLIQTGKEEAAPGSASMTPVKVMARCRVSATEGMNAATTASNYWRTSGQVVSWACTVKWMTRRDDLEFL